MEFKCSSCEYKSERKSNVKTHINKMCKNNASILEIPIEINCDFCKKSFTTVPSMRRHLSTCKVKKFNQNEEITKLKEENKILKALAKKPTTINNITNNQINIVLAPWNDPKLPNNVEDYYRASVKKIFLAVPTLIKNIHFNVNHPENHNISITNARSKTAKVYNGKEWESIDEDTLIRTLITDYEQTLEDYSDTNELEYTEKINEIKDRDTEERVYDDLHNEVKRVIYDRNHMVKIKKLA